MPKQKDIPRPKQDVKVEKGQPTLNEGLKKMLEIRPNKTQK
jgi:hypothetical protein